MFAIKQSNLFLCEIEEGQAFTWTTNPLRNPIYLAPTKEDAEKFLKFLVESYRVVKILFRDIQTCEFMEEDLVVARLKGEL